MSHGKYIVVFKEGTAQDLIDGAEQDVIAQGGKITHRYSATFKGFAAEIPDNALSVFTTNVAVDSIEPDGEVSIYAKQQLAKK
ncbi:hypothetical protein HK097_011521 [Rhizophlyctis rosea]|uniref:Inhibitor I9 domain-containing protein n=1 Tax=Rhizophlyctis rosea TaxID=64517 RepID=A0AAD5X1U2_9FUNG|nr:hypothetical protein HK097_011521 [Rhizophlyctis rosea]